MSRPAPVPGYDPMIRASVVSLIVDGLASRSLPVGPLLARHLSQPQQLDDPYAELELRRYVAIFEAAAALARDPFFGLRLAEEIEIEQFGPLGIVILAAPDLRRALRLWERYAVAWQSGTAIEVAEGPELTECVYQIADPAIRPRRQDSEFTLALTCRLFRGLVGRSWAPAEVQLEHAAPAGLETVAARRLYHRAFGTKVEFGAAANRIVIDSRDLGLTGGGAPHFIAPFVEQMLRNLLSTKESPERLSERVARLMRSRLGRLPVSATALAAELGLSPRTLQRRLAEEGSSLRALGRDCRRHLAETMLAEGDRQVTAIAHTLGYADTAVLTRAFKGWTGVTPRAFRRRGAS